MDKLTTVDQPFQLCVESQFHSRVGTLTYNPHENDSILGYYGSNTTAILGLHIFQLSKRIEALEERIKQLECESTEHFSKSL